VGPQMLGIVAPRLIWASRLGLVRQIFCGTPTRTVSGSASDTDTMADTDTRIRIRGQPLLRLFICRWLIKLALYTHLNICTKSAVKANNNKARSLIRNKEKERRRE